jgi:hypothetical protein
MSYKLYVLFCLVALFNTIHTHPTPKSWNEDGSDDWKPNPPVSIKPPLIPPGEPFIPNCVVSIDHGVYFNNCTVGSEPSVVHITN